MRRQLRLIYTVIIFLLLSSPFSVCAAPGDILYSENFNGNLNDWVVDNSGGGDAGIDNATADQGRSLFLRWDTVSVSSANTISAAVPGAEISLWVQRGDDSFSEDPDTGEDLVIEYLNASSTYVVLDTFAGAGTPGEVFTPSFTLPADGLHAGLRLRIRMLTGSGSSANNWDFWHIDSLVVVETAAAATACSESVADNFAAVSYSQNDGSENWTTDWLEVNENDGASAGISRVRNDRCSAGNCLRFGVPSGNPAQSYSNIGVQRELNLSGTSDATLSFNYFTGVASGSSTVDLDISSDGGINWTTLQTFTINTSIATAVPITHDISGFASANTRIRFLTSSGGAVLGMYVDDISIDYNRSCPIASAPIADWRMDETIWNGTSGEVVDSSTNAFNGTALGATTTSGFICNAGNFTADGTSDYVSLDSGAMNGLLDFTLSAWVQTTNTGSQGLLSGSSGSQHNEALWWWQNQNTFAPILKGSSSGGNISASINNGNWRHVVWRRSGSQNCLFVDGAQQGSCITRSSSALNIASGGLILAQEQDSLGAGFDPGQDWEGLIDELLIFDVSLSDADISQIYTNQLAGNNWDGTARTCPVSIAPVAEWRFDEPDWAGSSGEVQDNTGNGLNGTANGGASTISSGLLCAAGSFDGSDDYVEVPGIDALLSDTASLSFWINTTQAGNNTNWLAPGVSGVEQSGGTDDVFWGWLNAPGNIAVNAGNGSAGLSTTAINNGTWRHVVLTRNATTGQTQTFIDGVLETTSTSAPGVIGTAFSSIGRIEDTGGSPAYLQGNLDEVLIFDQIVDGALVQSIYNNQLAGRNWDGTTRSCLALAPYAEWRFDEPGWSGTAGEIIDSSGNNRNGVALGTAASVPNPTGSPGSALAGNPGTCGYGNFIADTTLNPSNAVDTGVDVNDLGDAGSIALWYFSNNDWIGGENRTLFDAPTGPFDKYFFLTLLNSGSLRFGLEDTSDGDFRFSTSAQSFLANQWVHIATTWDLPNDRMRIYVNGALVVDANPPTNGQLGELSNLFIGDNNGIYVISGDTTPNSANGGIDEVTIFDSVLSQSQVQSLMARRHDCLNAGPNRIEVVAPATASTCLPVDITVRACADAACSALFAGYSGTVDLTTSTSTGEWESSGGNNGQFSYTFTSGDGGQTTLQLSNNIAQDITITATDSTNASLTDTSTAITFSDNVFVINDTDSFAGDDVSVAGRDHAYNVSYIARDTTQAPPECGTVTDYNGAMSLKIWRSNDAANPAGATAPTVGGITVPAAQPAADNINLTFTAGEAAFSLASTDVGKYNINLLDDSLGFATQNVSGSSETLTVRPFALGFSLIQSAAGTDNPAGNEAGGNGFVAAGEDFNIAVGGFLYQASDDTNSDGFANSGADVTDNGVTPSFAATTVISLINDPTTPTPVTGTVGMFSGASVPDTSFSLGTNNTQPVSANYDEVGSIRLQADVSNYLGTSGVNVSGESPVIGRFYPDRFVMASSASVPGCGNFSYMDQGFMLEFTVDALNVAGDLAENYSQVLGYSNLASFNLHGEDNNDGTDRASRLTNPAATWSAGRYEVSTMINNSQFSRLGTGEDGPFQSLQLSLSVASEADGRNFETLDQKPSDINDCVVDGDCDAVGITLPMDFRYGRLVGLNAFGPVTTPLPVPIRAEFYNRSQFVTNTDDNCTVVASSQIDLNGASAPAAGSIINVPVGGSITNGSIAMQMIGGDMGFVFTAPSPANTGAGIIPFSLDTSALPWLQFDVNGDGSIDNPLLFQAEFGRYRGNDRVIYRREVLR